MNIIRIEWHSLNHEAPFKCILSGNRHVFLKRDDIPEQYQQMAKEAVLV
jgi:hypothetical protein